MDISEVFAAGGPIARLAGSRYEERQGQVELSAAIEGAFQTSTHLLCEAPTGTGKSLAYMIPAIRQVENRKRTIVVTANIALQEQLVTKDLPWLRDALAPTKFEFAIAKGIGNYLCLAAWEAVAGDLLFEKNPSPEHRALQAFAAKTKTGDLSELDIELSPRVKLSVVSSADECTGRRCEKFDDCFVRQARQAWASANIIVTNYHLFFADLALKAQGAAGLLPPYDFVVLDEAHAASDIAREFFGWRVSYSAIKRAVRLLPPADQQSILKTADRVFRGIWLDRHRPWISKPFEVCAGSLADQLDAAGVELTLLAGNELVADTRAKIEQCATRCGAIAANLREVDACDSTTNIYFAEKPVEEGGVAAIGMKPLSVAKILEGHLWNPATAKIASVIGTSATLTSDGDFDFIIGELGAEGAKTLSVESPFDHRGKATLICPRGLPEPSHRDFREVVGEIVVEVVTKAGGRTLGLFTSYRVLDEAYRALVEAQKRGDLPPYRILRQNDAPRTKLIEMFRDDVTSVLLGTASFWAGVDVQGESLSALVIDRLPFDHVEDPIVEAIRAKRPREWFGGYSLPRSIIEFRQGFGRVIRSKTDRGVIVVCDARLFEKPYGQRYIRSLPKGVATSRNLADIAEVLGPPSSAPVAPPPARLSLPPVPSAIDWDPPAIEAPRAPRRGRPST